MIKYLNIIIKLLATLLVGTMLFSCSPITQEPTFLFSSSDGVTNRDQEGFESAVNFGIDVAPRDIEIEELNGKKVSYGEYKDLTYRGSLTVNASDESQQNGEFYAVYDEYELKIDDGLVVVSYYHGTDKFRSFEFLDISNRDTSETITEEEARKIADELILSLIDKELFEKYTFIKVTTMQIGDRYCVYYQRQIEGYATEEVISVYLYENGDVWSILFDNVEKFDNVSAKLTKKKLDAAKDTLTEKIETMELKNMEMRGNPIIVTDVFGKVYLGISVNYSSEMGSILETFYISIE